MLADGPVQVGCRPEAELGDSMTIRIIGSGMKGQGIMRVLFQAVESCARCRYGEPVGLNLAEDASVTCTRSGRELPGKRGTRNLMSDQAMTGPLSLVISGVETCIEFFVGPFAMVKNVGFFWNRVVQLSGPTFDDGLVHLHHGRPGPAPPATGSLV